MRTDIKPVSFPTYEAVVPVSAPVPDGWANWPSHMQDKLLASFEKLTCPEGMRREIVRATCHSDPDGHYVRIVVMMLPETRQ